MKCPDCGRELEFIADLTEDEVKKLEYVISKLEMAVELTKFDIDFDSMADDKQISNYVGNVCQQLAEAKLQDILLFREIRDKYCPGEKVELKFLDGKVYKHPTNE